MTVTERRVARHPDLVGVGSVDVDRLADRIAFGSSYPFRALAQSIEDYHRLGFRDQVKEKIFYANAARLLCV